MPIVQGIIAGLIAGSLMGVVSELGYRLGIFKSNLFIIDGSFAMGLLKKQPTSLGLYLLGMPIHLMTGVIFGVTYLCFTDFLGWNPQSPGLLFGYAIFLWLSMISIALPIAGEGFLGVGCGRYVWLEQLIIHLFYGIGLRWALNII